MIGTQRRNCRGRPIVCPWPCNTRKHKRIENFCEKKHCHACSLFNVTENDDNGKKDDEEKEEVNVENIELPARVDEETITNVVLVNVALSQIAISEILNCPKDSDKATALCSEQEDSLKRLPGYIEQRCTEDTTTTTKRTNDRKVFPKSLAFLLAICIYGIVHFFLAVLAWRESLYEAFISSQICGFVAFVVYKITGTIPL